MTQTIKTAPPNSFVLICDVQGGVVPIRTQSQRRRATKWNIILDFYNALLAAIGAPEWHGMSPDALIDSMIWGGINAVEPPYTVQISGLATAPKEVRDHVELVKNALVEARIWRKRHDRGDVEASIVIAAVGDESVRDDEATKIRNAVAAVQYEGPDPKVSTGIEKLRQRLKLGPDRER